MNEIAEKRYTIDLMKAKLAEIDPEKLAALNAEFQKERARLMDDYNHQMLDIQIAHENAIEDAVQEIDAARRPGRE